MKNLKNVLKNVIFLTNNAELFRRYILRHIKEQTQILVLINLLCHISRLRIDVISFFIFRHFSCQKIFIRDIQQVGNLLKSVRWHRPFSQARDIAVCESAPFF